MNKLLKYSLLFFMFLLLVLIRAYNGLLFYDPLQNYFLNDYLHKPLPEIDDFKFFISIFLRYFLNSVISILILIFLFGKQRVLKFGLYFYLIVFVLLITLLFIVIKSDFKDYKLLFYIRRLLIHPVFLLILIPAFFQNRRLISS